MNLHGKYLHIAMESLARKCALYWMTEDALLLGTSTLFLTLAHQADWLEFPIPNKFFLTKSINQVCGEATTITSLNLPEWVLCFVRKLLPFFGYWPMDYLFITRVWILLWSCMWACDFLDFSWTLFVYPPVKGKFNELRWPCSRLIPYSREALSAGPITAITQGSESIVGAWFSRVRHCSLRIRHGANDIPQSDPGSSLPRSKDLFECTL